MRDDKHKPAESLAVPINVYVFGAHLKIKQLEKLFGNGIWDGLIFVHHPFLSKWKQGHQVDSTDFSLWMLQVELGPQDQIWMTKDFWAALFKGVQQVRGGLVNFGSDKQQKVVREFLGNLALACADGEWIAQKIWSGAKVVLMEGDDPIADRESRIKAAVEAIGHDLDKRGKTNLAFLVEWMFEKLGTKVGEDELRRRFREAYMAFHEGEGEET